ncbi:MAG: hypothetical protein JXO51_09670 [Candidatus Aminicenantes bacterium]|nr:hypothetical protein [Candidatus Aminicenantes bacterium]
MKRRRKGRPAAAMAALALLLALPVLAGEGATAAAPSRFSLGAGFGIPFGVIGVSCEMNPILGSGPDPVAKYFSLNLGLGVAVAGPGYSLGFRFYPLGRDRAWAPKVSLLYGVVAVVNWEDIVRGFSLGAGIVRRLRKKLSLDGDVILIINHFGFDYLDWDSVGRIKASLGVRWNLD